MRHGCAMGAPWVHDVSQPAFEVRVAHRAKSLSASRLGLWATAHAELAAPQHRQGPPQQPRALRREEKQRPNYMRTTTK